MVINCTLLVQCLNFGIAYVILSRLIFKPVLEAILEERSKREAIQKVIVASQAVVENLQAKRAADWKYAQKRFGQGLKKIPYELHAMPCSYEYEYASPTDAQVSEKAKRIHDTIMKKVTHECK
jgi:F0F1-type ATP synthase membrane subunit b/b'